METEKKIKANCQSEDLDKILTLEDMAGPKMEFMTMRISNQLAHIIKYGITVHQDSTWDVFDNNYNK